MNIQEYKYEIEKQASLGAIASKVLPAVAKGVKSFGAMSGTKRALIGAGANAALKGVTYKPTSSESGIKGRLGAMAGGALTGATAGLALSNSNVSSAGSQLSKAGEKIFDLSSKIKSEPGSDMASGAGYAINTFGEKVKDYFAK